MHDGDDNDTCVFRLIEEAEGEAREEPSADVVPYYRSGLRLSRQGVCGVLDFI